MSDVAIPCSHPQLQAMFRAMADGSMNPLIVADWLEERSDWRGAELRELYLSSQPRSKDRFVGYNYFLHHLMALTFWEDGLIHIFCVKLHIIVGGELTHDTCCTRRPDESRDPMLTP